MKRGTESKAASASSSVGRGLGDGPTVGVAIFNLEFLELTVAVKEKSRKKLLLSFKKYD